MSRLGPPSVEVLPDITWARVERDLFAALDRMESSSPEASAPPPRSPRRWTRYAVGVGIALAAAVVIVLAWPRGSARSHDLPSRVATAESPTTVSFGDAEITVAEQSTVVLAGTPARGVDIVLEEGSATFAVAPRAGRPPFVVHAGAADIRVVGTRFTVTRSGDAARVEVTHGEVEVVAHGRRELLLAGGSWDSSRDWEAATRSSATVANPGDVAAARTSSDDAADTAADLPAPPPAGEVKPPVRAQPPVDPRAAYEAAAALEPADAGAALAAYRKIARGSGPWAANALYAAARLADQEGRTDLALSLARQYAKRFPRGANAADAARLAARLEGATNATTP